YGFLTNGALRILDAQTGAGQLLTGHRIAPYSSANSRDGRWVLSGGPDHELRLWDLSTGSGRLLGTHQASILTVAISGDSKWGFSAGDDSTIEVGELATAQVRRLPKGHVGAVRRILPTFDGRAMVSIGDDRTVRIWHLTSGGARVLRGHDSVVVTGAMA